GKAGAYLVKRCLISRWCRILASQGAPPSLPQVAQPLALLEHLLEEVGAALCIEAVRALRHHAQHGGNIQGGWYLLACRVGGPTLQIPQDRRQNALLVEGMCLLSLGRRGVERAEGRLLHHLPPGGGRPARAVLRTVRRRR